MFYTWVKFRISLSRSARMFELVLGTTVCDYGASLLFLFVLLVVRRVLNVCYLIKHLEMSHRNIKIFNRYTDDYQPKTNWSFRYVQTNRAMEKGVFETYADSKK